MSKIIKVKEYVDLSIKTEFSKNLGVFEVRATLWSCVSACETGYNHDIVETDLRFLDLNSTVYNYLGFKELYEKLYGVNKFNEFRDDLMAEFEEEYFKQTTYKN